MSNSENHFLELGGYGRRWLKDKDVADSESKSRLVVVLEIRMERGSGHHSLTMGFII